MQHIIHIMYTAKRLQRSFAEVFSIKNIFAFQDEVLTLHFDASFTSILSIQITRAPHTRPWFFLSNT